jgi:uncharacterized protein (UPF0262 family)
MPLREVVLDEGTLQRGSEAQRAEWDKSIGELLETATCNIDQPARLCVDVTEQGFILRFETIGGEELATVAIEHAMLSEHVTDYLDIVRQITAADSLNQMEALDMAKKVTHDRVGRLLKRELRGLAFDLESSRRLFTLLLSLKVDTTRLPGLRGHRGMR